MRTVIFLTLLFLVSCGQQNKFEPDAYYKPEEQDRILSRIIAHIFSAPPYVTMENRLKKEHENYYLSLTPKFSLLKLHVTENGMHYFLVERPGPGSEHRAVGGSFKVMNDSLVNFKEVFVTPALADSVLESRSEFLFEEWMKGDLQRYLVMPSYVQWPNKGSYYDTITFEWKLKPEVVYDTLSIP